MRRRAVPVELGVVFLAVGRLLWQRWHCDNEDLPDINASGSATMGSSKGALEYSPTGYFGNEGSDAAFYVSAALLVDVPSTHEKGVRS